MSRPAIHPGEILAGELDEIGMSADSVARALHVPVRQVSRIVKGQGGISAEMPIRLGHWFGAGPELWMNLQKQYELRLAEQEVGKKTREKVKPRAVSLLVVG